MEGGNFSVYGRRMCRLDHMNTDAPLNFSKPARIQKLFVVCRSPAE